MTRFYRMCLWLYPRAFRERFGDEMMELQRDRLRHTRQHGGASAVAALWFRTFGGLVGSAFREHVDGLRAPSRTPWTGRGDVMIQDLKYALRSFRRRPGVTAAILGTLAVGIGLNSLAFSVVDAVLLESLPFDAPERLVMVWNRYGTNDVSSSPPDYVDRRDRSELLESIAAFSRQQMNLSGTNEPEQVQVTRVTASFFDVLGVGTLPGPPRFPHEESGEDGKLAVLSHGLWLRRFGGVGGVSEIVRLDGESYRVQAIAPPGFDYPLETDLWIPRQFRPDQLADDYRGNEFLSIVARLTPDASLEQARAEMNAIAASVIERVPDRAAFLERNGWAATLTPLTDELVGSYRTALLVLWGSVGLVLVIACATVANLLLAQSDARAREMSVRMSLGASRRRLVRQLITESFVLAMAGAGLGLGVAYALIDHVPGWVPHELPRLDAVSLEPRVVSFTLVLGAAASLLFGLAPSLRATTSRTGNRRLTSLLVVHQVAIAIVLMISAGLLFESFRTLTALDPGFATDGRMSFRVSLPRQEYPDQTDRQRFVETLLSRLSERPGVTNVASSFRLPLDGAEWTATFYPVPYEALPGEPTPGADFNIVSPGYFRTLDIPLLAGRDFTDRDNGDAPRVVIMDRETAERFWPYGTAVGSHINLNDPEGEEPDLRQIVGLVGRVSNESLGEDGRPQLYLPSAQTRVADMGFTIETDGDPATLIGAMRGEVAALDPNLPIYRVRTLDEMLARTVALPRFNLSLLGGFALLALALAVLGVYGVLTHSVGSRTAEIGTRIALGARRSNIIALVLRDASVLVGLGLAIGWLGAVALTRFLSSLLYEVEPTDAATFASVSIVLVLTAFAAALVPACRAARLSPTAALRVD